MRRREDVDARVKLGHGAVSAAVPGAMTEPEMISRAETLI